jgi:prepilin-type N-terminal cleavage/methylation domain-containing protein
MFLRGTPHHSHNQGKTLLELLIVLVIIAILASLVMPLTSYFKRRAQDATCMANLRGLHAGFSGYLGDHAFVWPQSPEHRKDAQDDIDEDELCKWWIDQLKPYGLARKSWICQADPVRSSVDLNDEKHYDMSYIPTPFDEVPNRAYDWKSQPWLIEQGGFHDKGAANKVMPDGSIQKDAFPMPTE